MIELLTFENVMEFARLATIGIGLLVMIKQRTEVIIAKYKQRAAEEEAKEWEKVARSSNSQIKFVADTQLKIVQASKLSVEDKTDITKKYVNYFEETKEVKKEAVKEEKVSIVETIMDEAVNVGTYFGLLNDENKL